METNDEEYTQLASIIGGWYAEAEIEIIDAIARRTARGINEPSWYDQKLGEIEGVKKDVRAILTSQVSKVKDALSSGINKTFLAAFGGDRLPTKANFSVIETLAKATMGRIEKANLQILRTAGDAFRNIIADSAGLAATGAVTRERAANRSLAQFADQGVTSFTDTKGRKWGMPEYTEMATRTALTQARVEGNTARYEAEGYELVTVPPSPEPCKLCDPFENGIFVLKGTHAKYKPLKDAISGGLFHPNCTHRIVPYIEGLTRLAERKPKAERRAGYDERQKQRGIERDIRKWKKREAAAITPEEKKKARAKVKEKQAEMRAFIEDTGRLRSSRRENLGGNIKPPPRAPDFDPTVPPTASRGTKAIVDWAKKKLPNVRFDLDGMAPEFARRVLGQLGNLTDKWPGVGKKLAYVGFDRNPTGGNAAWETEYARATTRGKEPILIINPRYFRDSDARKLDEELRGAKRVGHMVGNKVEHIITHEFGHLLDNYLTETDEVFTRGSRADGFGFVNQLMLAFGNKYGQTGDADSISRYAVSGDSYSRRVETWAESFVKSTHFPGEPAGKYTKLQNALLQILAPANIIPGETNSSIPPYRTLPEDEKLAILELMEKVKRLLKL